MNYATAPRASLDDLTFEVQLHFAEAPRQLIEQYVLGSVREFCERSGYWQEYLGDIYVVRDLFEYDVPVPTDADLVEISRVFRSAGGDEHDFDKGPHEGLSPYHYWSPSASTVLLYPNDRLSDTSVGVVATLKPNESALVAQPVMNDYRDALVSGAMARMYRMARQSWSDGNLYLEHQRLFEQAANKARRRVGRGYQVSPDRLAAKPRSYY